MDQISISIIVPLYNEEKYLVRCIESLINQTIKEIEIILIDDGSTDNSPAICDYYAQNNENVFVYHKSNEGQGIARNYGLDKARGIWVGFVDADDFVDTNMYEELHRIVNENAAQMASCLMFSNKKTLSDNTDDYKIYSGRLGISNIALGMVGTKPDVTQDMIFGMSVCRSIFRLDVIKENNITFLCEKDISSEDLLFNLMYLRYIDKLVYSSHQFYYYCYNALSTTHTFHVEMFDRDKKLIAYVRDILSQISGVEEANQSADRLLLTKVRIEILNCTYSIKDIGFRKVYRNLNKYVRDEEVRKVIKRYPGKRLSGNRKLVFYLLKYKLTSILLIASYIFGKKMSRI